MEGNLFDLEFAYLSAMSVKNQIFAVFVETFPSLEVVEVEVEVLALLINYQERP